MDGDDCEVYLGGDASDGTYQMVLPGALAASEVNEGSDAGSSALGSAFGSTLPGKETAADIAEAASLRDEMALHGVMDYGEADRDAHEGAKVSDEIREP